jgi:hypothetical protein
MVTLSGSASAMAINRCFAAASSRIRYSVAAGAAISTRQDWSSGMGLGLGMGRRCA